MLAPNTCVPTWVLATVLFGGVMHTPELRADPTNLVAGPTMNGIFASVEDLGNLTEHGHVIEVYIHFTAPSTNPAWGAFPKVIKQTNGGRKYIDPSRSWFYFMPTNSFCGFVELREENGRKMRLLKPEVNSPEAYPQSFKLHTVRKILMNKIYFWNGPPLPQPLVGATAGMRFNLMQYFKIKQPGTYQLTVWPKIYKRLSTNDDLCVRNDLPSVTVPIIVNGREWSFFHN